MNIGFIVGVGIVALIVVGIVLLGRNAKKRQAEYFAKHEALFASMFPELQPLYHPKNVLEFVRARLAQAPAPSGMRMNNPPGFAVRAAEVSFDTDKKGQRRELWRLLDDAGREVTRFFFDSDAKDGMLRVGAGKFRVGRKEDRVRYWHPDREFKWTPPGYWKFTTRVFDQPTTSSDSGLSFDSPSSSSSTARTAAAAAGIMAAGGTFDGGGASAAWDGKSSSGSDAADGDTATAGATSY